MPQSAAARVATAARRVRCVELAATGMTYAQIAADVGFANKSSARKAVLAALASREVEAVEDLRRLEVTRLDALQAAAWEDALTGDVGAIDRILRIIDRRMMLMGLNGPRRSDRSQESASVVHPSYWESLQTS